MSATELTSLRRHLHAHPELSERERDTAAAIIRWLAATGPTAVMEGLGHMQTGICAIYDSGEPGPAVLIRCELDALPIQETNTFEHRSTVDGVSHKCGHDGHMATLVAVAESLHERPVSRGKVYLLFQPAEETGTGRARGTKLNVPLAPGAEDAEFRMAWRQVEAYLDAAEPEFIIFQCGADSLLGDPITHLCFSEQAHADAAATLCRLADKHCEGRLIGAGGGGYNRDNIARAWTRVVQAFVEAA